MDDIGGLAVETPLVKVPYENLRRVARARSLAVTDGVGSVVKSLDECSTSDSRGAAVDVLESIASQLQGLKRKLDEADKQERVHAHRCKVRMDHMDSAMYPKLRLDRILVDHMLRSGYHTSALKLAKEAGVEELVDTGVFLEAQRVAASLEGHDCAAALAWCEENRSKLKKMKSKLEFKLRIQEFIELVREGRVMDAIKYARSRLACFADGNMKELQQAMATLAFRKDTECQVYAEFFSESRWGELVDALWQDVYLLNNLTTQSVLAIYLQAGLSALKTPLAYTEECPKEDPLHLDAFRRLAEDLPFAKHIHSKLVCHISKDIMNEHNPPMVLPNGMVYSREALQEMAERCGGEILCPRTGFKCAFGDLAKAYIS